MQRPHLIDLNGTFSAALEVLLDLMPHVIRQLVVTVKNRIRLGIFAIHGFQLPTSIIHARFRAIGPLPALPATSGWRGTACFWPFLPLYSTSHRSCAASGPDNASSRKPCARGGSACRVLS